MWLAVPGQEALQADHVGQGRGTDQDRPGGLAFDEIDTTQDQCAHDALAQVGLGHHEGPHALRGHDQRLHIALGPDVHRRGQPRQLRQLGGKFTCLHFGDRRYAAETIVLRQGDLAAQHDAHARAWRTVPRDELAVPIMMSPAEALDASQLGGGENRKHLRTPAVRYQRGSYLGHWFSIIPSPIHMKTSPLPRGLPPERISQIDRRRKARRQRSGWKHPIGS